MASSLWNFCLKRLEVELTSQEFNTWIRPLQAQEDEAQVTLFAPNNFVLNWVKKNFLERISDLLQRGNHDRAVGLRLQVGTCKPASETSPAQTRRPRQGKATPAARKSAQVNKAADAEKAAPGHSARLNPKFTFQSFVRGRSNQLAHAASQQAAETGEFNPLFIYGGVGLGKTHLMHAVGHDLRQRKPDAKILCVSSERFVEDMVKAIHNKRTDEFKSFYRSADVLLMDDIQFLAGKVRSQEEFLHTFNSLMEGSQQLIMTCDRPPTQIMGLEERLKSRFGAGLTVTVDKPELNTRIAILHSKAQQAALPLPGDVAHFIAENLESNIRELEGALHRLLASAKLLHEEITLDFSREMLKDLINFEAQNRILTIQDIQQAVAEHFGLSLDVLLSRRRQRTIVRPRQIAMSLVKELTGHNLPAIGQAFGGRDRTTVLHSCKTIRNLQQKDTQLQQDYLQLRDRLSA